MKRIQNKLYSVSVIDMYFFNFYSDSEKILFNKNTHLKSISVGFHKNCHRYRFKIEIPPKKYIRYGEYTYIDEKDLNTEIVLKFDSFNNTLYWTTNFPPCVPINFYVNFIFIRLNV